MVFGLGLAVSFGYWCTDFLQVQRVIVAKDLRSAQNGTIIGAGLKMLVPIIVTIPGLLGLAVLLNTDGSPLGPAGGNQHHLLVKLRTCITSIKSRSGSSSAACCSSTGC
jgi:hypothetical protein